MCNFEGAQTRRQLLVLKTLTTRGSTAMLPQKILKFRVSEMPFPAFSVMHFQ